ncbi:hypothetical protein ACMT4L_17035 [Deinococcus sp. A31D244]
MPTKKPGDTEHAPDPDLLRPLIYWAALALGGTLGYWLGALAHL